MCTVAQIKNGRSGTLGHYLVILLTVLPSEGRTHKRKEQMTSCFPNFLPLQIPWKIQELKKWGTLNKVCLTNTEALQFILGMPRRTNKLEELNVLRQTDQFPQTLIECFHVTSTVVPLILLDK